MRKPIVSIILSTYNNAAYLKDAIASVCHQSFDNWQLIIINDNSADKTESIVKTYIKDKRIQYVRNKKNKGLVKNLLRGVALAKGEYIARIDGDDIWVDRNKLKKQVQFLESHPEYGLVGSFANIIDANGKLLLQSKNPVTDEEIRNYIMIENCFFHSSILMRKKIFDKVGGYDPTTKTAEDYNLWLKIGLTSKMHNIPELLISYRINPQGINATKYKYQLKETIKIIKQFRNDYPNFHVGLLLWYLRGYIPKRVKTFVSELLKSRIALTTLRQAKATLLNAHYSL